MKIRRVLMTGDTVGGVWTFTLELISALRNEEIEFVLATMGGEPTAAQRAQAAQIGNLCLIPSGYRLEWMEEPWADVEESGRWLRDIADDFSPDVIHLNTFGHVGLRWKAPVVLTAHSCVYSWWRAVRGDQPTAEWARYGTLVRNALHSAEALVAPSAAMAADLKACYGDLPECAVIANGIDPQDFRVGVKEPFVFCAGRLWDDAKNLTALVQAAPSLGWPVCIAGESRGSGTAGCRELGRLSAAEMRDWYARAEIYAMPARYEPFGLSILEAAVSGCALVLGDIPSLRENWHDAALFADPGDSMALAAVANRLIGDEGGRRAMARRARERGLQFSAARMAQSYFETYLRSVTERRTACAL